METTISTQAREFMVYIRTQMFFRSRLKGLDEDMKVYISSKEVESFFPYQRHDRKREIENLINSGELKITQSVSNKSGQTVYYKALKPGEMDIRYIKTKPPSNDSLIKEMMRHLKTVSLIPGSPSTLYFDAFLKFKDRFMEVFFSEDSFCGRIHTPITNIHSENRSNILMDGKETLSFDVATIQPLLLGKILKEQIGANEFSTWIDSGKDIYTELMVKARLENRNQGKKRFFEMLFSQPTDELAKMFGEATWITWINEYKTKVIPDNPHSQFKPHSNLAWLLQCNEVRLMRKVWTSFSKNRIPFLTVHDEIIVQCEYGLKAETIFKEVLKDTFTAFKLNCSGKLPEPEKIYPIQSVGDFFNMAREYGFKHMPKNSAVNAGIWRSQN